LLQRAEPRRAPFAAAAVCRGVGGPVGQAPPCGGV